MKKWTIGCLLFFFAIVFCTGCSQTEKSTATTATQSATARLKSNRIGASFTISHAMWLNGSWGGPRGDGEAVGPPWQESLKAEADSGVSTVRLSHPWDLVEPEQGKFNWKELDEAITICEQAGVEIVLCIGVKSPRYPEYHPPGWIKAEVEKRLKPKPTDELKIAIPDQLKKQIDELQQLVKKDPNDKALLDQLEEVNEQLNMVMAATPKARDAIKRYLTAAVIRYRDRASIKVWQVENEPLTFTRPMALSQVKEEIELVRSLDSKKRPILVTTWTAVDVPPEWSAGWTTAVEQIIPLGDIVGFDCYIKSHEWETQEGHWQLVKQWMASARKQGKKVWITEWQAEPWEEGQKMDFKDPYGNKSFNPKLYEDTFQLALRLKPDKILLWGEEFQIACKKQGNSAWRVATAHLFFDVLDPNWRYPPQERD